ncbi:ribose-phosphate pyrophosphokinase [Legionella jordanis]|uniref:ribose-phosphate pyrophosphokinase n=1 Tax=Legionella jordanis TaxID=456 RepID=UPI001F389D4A|nr:ribose-phosphate pyrophosphokinase [Legionella jordanis]
MKPILISLEEDGPWMPPLLAALDVEHGEVIFRRFPDSECYLRINFELKNRKLIVVASLNNPDAKILFLTFLAQAAKDGGAKSVGLIAPYLCYLRQDKQFHTGEVVTSRYFAKLLSNSFDWLMTVDPHLHRYQSLNEIYTVPSFVLHAGPCIADWIQKNLNQVLIIGPDDESQQWVSGIADLADCSYVVLKKNRSGDKEVQIFMPPIDFNQFHSVVLMDDIISTGRTMLETIKLLQAKGVNRIICIAVHALFSEDAYELLAGNPAVRLVSCNTIRHVSNAIDINEILINALMTNQLAKKK